ncbi:MAG TPA: glycosyltransferase family 39 protein, partial [Polyangiaceae bacterium]|nr:glycosyltransferase family 39 protein [Polyangiaceae bacterium]
MERVARVVVLVASAWFAFTALWGLFAIPGGGHLGAGSAGNVMAAEQMIKWHIIYPAWNWYDGQPPPKIAYICHHPFGQYWVPAVFLAVFGHHDVVVRLPAALMSVAIPPMLYGIAREKWGVPAGAVATASYVVLPIAVGFSQFLNLETFCIFGALLFFWGHTRHMVTGRRRHLAASLVGLVFAVTGDWAGYLLVAPMLAWALARVFLVPVRLTPRFPRLPYARWWALSLSIVVGSALLWLYLFYDAGQLVDWIGAAQNRGGGEGMKLKAVFDARKNWIDFSFTPLAILLGKLAVPVCFLRLLVTRRDEESYSLSLCFGAAAQYVGFKQGADIHIFWSHYFAPYFALAMAQLFHSFGAVVAFVVRRFSWRLAPIVASWVTLTMGLIPVAAMTRDGVASLWVWRRTGGRYDENGGVIRSHLDMLRVLELVVNPVTVRGTPIDTHPSAQWGWEHLWKYQGLGKDAQGPLSGTPSAASHPFWIARGSGMGSDEQRRLVATAHVRIYGDTWLVDQREPNAPLDAYSLNEREPGFFEWLLVDPTEVHRTVGKTPDPWLTWEWRAHLGQDAPLPTGQPATLDEVRIAHNAAVAKGDHAEAERWREKLDAVLDRTVTAKYDTGLALIGVRVLGGVEPRVEAWFEVGKAFAGDATFAVKSSIER